jgi:hypothetical protein
MADLSHLGGLNPVEALDLENYADNKEKVSSFRLPPKGVYTVQAPDSFPAAAFSRTKAGSLQIQIDPTIVGPTHEGTLIRFVKISAKTFERNKQIVSQVGDYLRACGFRGTLANEQEIADAIEATANAIYQVKLDWRAYNKRTGYSLEGMERFPKLEDGTHQPWVIDPAEEGKVDEEGRQLRVFANLTIPFGGFIPSVD